MTGLTIRHANITPNPSLCRLNEVEENSSSRRREGETSEAAVSMRPGVLLPHSLLLLQHLLLLQTTTACCAEEGEEKDRRPLYQDMPRGGGAAGTGPTPTHYQIYGKCSDILRNISGAAYRLYGEYPDFNEKDGCLLRASFY